MLLLLIFPIQFNLNIEQKHEYTSQYDSWIKPQLLAFCASWYMKNNTSVSFGGYFVNLLIGHDVIFYKQYMLQ